MSTSESILVAAQALREFADLLERSRLDAEVLQHVDEGKPITYHDVRPPESLVIDLIITIGPIEEGT